MLKNLFQFFATALAIVAGAAGLSAQMTPANVEVVDIKGEVEAINEFGNEGELRRGRPLGGGVEISTGKNGVVKLAFPNGVRLTVEQGSRVRLTKFLLVRNGATRESGFTRISTDKEPSLSSTELAVVQGSVLIEIPPLNIPASNFLLNTNYHRAVIQEPKDEAHRKLLSKPVVMRFEQGLDFGRLTVFKGVVFSAPNHKDLGPASDVTEGNSVTYRFHRQPHYEAVRDDPGANLSDPVDAPLNGGDPDSPPGVREPRQPDFRENIIDTSLIIEAEPPKRNLHRNGLL